MESISEIWAMRVFVSGFTRPWQGHQQRCVLCFAKKLVLVPNGDGDTAHMGSDVQVPEVGSYELQEGVFALGREQEQADIIIPLPTVSSRHAMVKVEEGNAVWVTDLGSTNGTYVDGVEIEPMVAVRCCFMMVLPLKTRPCCVSVRHDDLPMPSG